MHEFYEPERTNPKLEAPYERIQHLAWRAGQLEGANRQLEERQHDLRQQVKELKEHVEHAESQEDYWRGVAGEQKKRAEAAESKLNRRKK